MRTLWKPLGSPLAGSWVPAGAETRRPPSRACSLAVGPGGAAPPWGRPETARGPWTPQRACCRLAGVGGTLMPQRPLSRVLDAPEQLGKRDPRAGPPWGSGDSRQVNRTAVQPVEASGTSWPVPSEMPPGPPVPPQRPLRPVGGCGLGWFERGPRAPEPWLLAAQLASWRSPGRLCTPCVHGLIAPRGRGPGGGLVAEQGLRGPRAGSRRGSWRRLG